MGISTLVCNICYQQFNGFNKEGALKAYTGLMDLIIICFAIVAEVNFIVHVLKFK